MPDLPFTTRLADLRHWIAERNRNTKRAFLIGFDFLLLIGLVWVSFSFRFGRPFVPNLEQALLIMAAPLIAIPIFIRTGLYRAVLRYLPERAIWTIVQAVTIATLVWVALAFLTQMTGAEGIPRTIPVVFYVLAVAAMVGTRFGAKWLLHGEGLVTHRRTHTLLYGTGDAATQLANALRSSPDRFVLGFVSDDPTLHGMDVLGMRVYAPNDLPRVVANFGIDEIIITSASPNADERRDFVTQLGSLPVKIRILPPIADLAAGRYLVSYIRDIDIDDLLGRSEVPADPRLLRQTVQDRTVLVTGAAGSIGSAVCRAIAGLKPAKLILLELNEHGLYQIARELRAGADFPVVALLGSVTDPARVDAILAEHRLDTIYHCAAYKHVSLVEENAIEGVRNNVHGTYILAGAAHRHGVRNFVLISSDKAVRPASVMGATKRLSELIVRHFGTDPGGGCEERNFLSVRFGNVIGSSGSVVPLFKEQIARGGPVTVTHNEMTRYFMSVREAAELIIQASALSECGDILLLEMGPPIRIRDLAEDMVALAGLSIRDEANPHGDIEIVEIGPQPGEKMHEELFYDPDGVAATHHPKILRARRTEGVTIDVAEMIGRIDAALAARDEEALRALVFDYVRRWSSPPGTS